MNASIIGVEIRFVNSPSEPPAPVAITPKACQKKAQGQRSAALGWNTNEGWPTPTGLPMWDAVGRPVERVSANCADLFGNAFGVRVHIVRPFTQGALRDPGLRSVTPSACVPVGGNYANGVSEQSPGPAQRRPGSAGVNKTCNPERVADGRRGRTQGVWIESRRHDSVTPAGLSCGSPIR